MQFSDLVSDLYAAPDMRARFAELRTKPAPKVTGIDLAPELAIAAFDKRRSARALAIACALLVATPTSAVRRLRRAGVFRCSRYGYHATPLRTVIAELLAPAMGLASEDVLYLRSVLALLCLAEDLRALRESVVVRLRKRRTTVVKTLLARLNQAFAAPRIEVPDHDSRRLSYYSAEEIAEATSLLLDLFSTAIGLEPRHLFDVDESAAIDTTYYDDIVVDAAKIAEFRSAEVLIDAFPYEAVREGNTICISSREPSFEKSVRLGYVQTSMQLALLGRPISEDRQQANPNVLSISRMAQDMLNRLGERLVVLKSSPAPYFSLRLPDVPAFFEIFSSDSLFLEDLVHLHALSKEDYLSSDTVIALPIQEDVTVLDILKVQRLVEFMHRCYAAALADYVLPNAPAMRLRSAVIVLRAETWHGLLEKLLPPHKVQALTRILTCPLDKKSKIDLQYTPVLRLGGFVAFSPALLAGSNLVRNLLTRAGKRLFAITQASDPMPNALERALASAGFAVAQGVRVRGYEIDIVAFREGHCFVFECKNAFHPCSTHELRTTYEHIVHAAAQLNDRASALSQPKALEELFRNQRWPYQEGIQRHTAIVCSNRLFNGYVCEGHPVRHARQLANLLTDGTFMLDDIDYRLWKSDTFSVDDLLAYLEGSIVWADFEGALVAYARDYSFGKSQLSFSTFVLDVKTYMERVTARYPRAVSAAVGKGEE